MTSTFRAQTPADLIGALPSLYGFVPSESLCVLMMDNTNGNRITMGMRIDLPTFDESVHAAEEIDRIMQAQGAERIMVIGLSDDRQAAHHRVGMVETVASMHVIVSGVASVGRWYDQTKWEFEEPDAGEPYGDPMTSVATATAVSVGQVVHPSRKAKAEQFTPTPAYPWFEPVSRESLTFEQFTEASDQSLIEYAHSSEGHGAIMGVLTRDNAADVAARLLDVAKKAHPDNAGRLYGLTAFSLWLAGDGMGALTAIEHAKSDPLARTITLAAGTGINPTTWWDHRAEQEGQQ